ncbi:MAG: hypothetical protein LBD50_02925 [Rickettsiales bacterium]|jgi:hypothetical protein|nr:hypothetical protein [Rickettsiales bacterium]
MPNPKGGFLPRLFAAANIAKHKLRLVFLGLLALGSLKCGSALAQNKTQISTASAFKKIPEYKNWPDTREFMEQIQKNDSNVRFDTVYFSNFEDLLTMPGGRYNEKTKNIIIPVLFARNVSKNEIGRYLQRLAENLRIKIPINYSHEKNHEHDDNISDLLGLTVEDIALVSDFYKELSSKMLEMLIRGRMVHNGVNIKEAFSGVQMLGITVSDGRGYRYFPPERENVYAKWLNKKQTSLGADYSPEEINVIASCALDYISDNYETYVMQGCHLLPQRLTRIVAKYDECGHVPARVMRVEDIASKYLSFDDVDFSQMFDKKTRSRINILSNRMARDIQKGAAKDNKEYFAAISRRVEDLSKVFRDQVLSGISDTTLVKAAIFARTKENY